MLVVKYGKCWKCKFFKEYEIENYDFTHDFVMKCSLKEYERVYGRKYDEKIKCILL